MSWWDASGFSSFASQALKNAQKKIDEVLDIGDEARKPGSSGGTKTLSSSKPSAKKSSEEGDFWNSWLGSKDTPETQSPTENTQKSKTPSASSWSTGWGASGQADTSKNDPVVEKTSWSEFGFISEKSESATKLLESEQVKGSSSEQQDAGKTASESVQQVSGKDVVKKEKLGPLQFGSKQSSVLSGSSSTKSDAEPELSTVKVDPGSETAGKGEEPEGPSHQTGIFPRVLLSSFVGKSEKTYKTSGEPRLETEGSQDGNISAAIEGVDISVASSDPVCAKGQDEKVVPVSTSEGIMVKSGESSQEVERESTSVSDTGLIDTGCASEVSDMDKNLTTEMTQFGTSGAYELDCEPLVEVQEDSQKSLHEISENAENVAQMVLEQLTESEQDLLIDKVRTDDNLPSSEDQKYHTEENQSEQFHSVSTSVLPQATSDADSRAVTGIETSDLSVECSDIKVTGSMSVLDVPSDMSEQLNVNPDMALSTSESSIVTLSSPGQDDTILSEGSSFQENTSRTVDSGYINISTGDITSVQNLDAEEESGEPDGDASCVEEEFPERGKEHVDAGQFSGNDSSDTSRLDSSLDTCTSGETIAEQHGMVAKGGSENEYENLDKSDFTLLETSPDSSFVKCMIKEAMEDMFKPEDSGSDNHSSGEKSEGSKFESEIEKSISGHASSDEIETTTSSDIEILSAPTPNGDKNDRPFDLSPLRIALQKTAHRGSPTRAHRRTDSQSSSSTYSKAGDSEQMSPGRDSLERQDLESGDEDLHASELSAVREEDHDNPYHPQRLLQKLAEKAEILQHRENKLVQLSKENNDLLEANSILRNQLQQLEELREGEMTDLNTLTEEFTKRLTESERTYQSAIKEKENLKNQLKTVQEELNKRTKDASLQHLLEEKDEQISELMQEGEKLSKQQLQSNNIIKKLRTKEKESDSVIMSQKKKLDESTTELEHLRKVLDAKEDIEKKQIEAIGQLNLALQKQEKEMVRLKSDHDESLEKVRSLQVTLDSSYKELADLHKANAAKDSKAQEAALSASMQVREELRFAMEKENQRYKQERESLVIQIEDLRLTVARMEKEHNRREDMLRQEISDLQLQLQEDEARNQELTQNVSSATRPLLRQIENIQSTFAAQSSSWERVEKTLTDRLADAQNQLAVAVEKERTASERVMELTSRVTSLESQTSRLRQEKSQLLAQAEIDKTKIELLEDAKHNEMAQVEAVKKQMSKEITELKREKVFLETQLEMERTKLESEKRRVALAEEQIKILERERPRSRGTPSPVSVSRQESVSSFSDHPSLLATLPQEDLLERSLMLASPNGSKMSLYESLRQSGAATLLENLQAQLKQKEGEIVQLQSEISSLERTRESMAKELVNLTNKNEDLQEQVLELPELNQKYNDLDQRYNALLQMYGEKVEQAQELLLDLEDVKEMYKAQIDELLTK